MAQVSTDRAETISKLEVSENNVLHVKLGGNINDGQLDWIPGPKEIEAARDEWQQVVDNLGLNVKVIVTHHLTELKVIKPDGR